MNAPPRERLAALPLLRLAHLPTPLEECRALASHLVGGPRILVSWDMQPGSAIAQQSAQLE